MTDERVFDDPGRNLLAADIDQAVLADVGCRRYPCRWVNSKRSQLVADRRKAAAAAGKTWDKPKLMARGKAVYQKQCVFCHGANGEGAGTFPKLAGSKIATGPVKNHIDIVMDGKPGTPMRAFKGEISKADIAAVVTYERNAFGNNTGDVVQPSSIK